MKKIYLIIFTLVSTLLLVFFCIEVYLSAITHFDVLMSSMMKHSMNNYYPWLLWVGLGCAIFPIINHYKSSAMKFYKVSVHEKAHAVTAVLTFRKMHSYNVRDDGNGVVYTSGNETFRFMTSLAPYCFPYFTLLFLLIKCIVTQPFMPIIDLLIGFTIGLHSVCIKEQLKRNASDLRHLPLWFDFLYITTIWAFFLSLILLCYEPGSNIFLAFKDYASDLWHYFNLL